MVLYTVIEKQDKDQGIIGVDEMGIIIYIGSKGLIEPLRAFFQSHHSFTILDRDGDMLVKRIVEPREQLSWIKELRRQIPAPYYGSKILEMVGTLDTLTSEWEKLSNKDYDICRF